MQRWYVRLITGCLAVVVTGAGVAAAAGPFIEPDVQTLFTLTGEEVSDNFGWVAAGVGDLNGDGIEDLLTTAPAHSSIAPRAGRIYLFSGANGTLLHTIDGGPRELFGYSATSAGDVNADGTPDYIIGGPGGPRSEPAYRGRASVYSGRDHTLLHELRAPLGIGFGTAVGTAGDVNHDGHADLIVGAEQASMSFPQAGRVAVYSGKDGHMIWSMDGLGSQHLLGSGVGLVGDVDLDGTPDLVAAARGAGHNGRGEAYVLSGSDGRLIHTLQAGGVPVPPLAGTFGQFFANGAGDLNADGIPDIYIGDYNASRGTAQGTGRVYIFSGATGQLLRLLHAEQPGDGFGPGRGIDDIDGDGHADLFVAAYTASAGTPGGGKAYLISGRTKRVLRTITGAIAGGNLGGDALVVGDLNGDGKRDLVVTAYPFGQLGTVYVIAGDR